MQHGNPVLLIHGLGDTSRLFEKMSFRLKRDSERYDVHTLDLAPNNGDEPLDRLARQIENYVDARIKGPCLFDLVAFSMGGIVARYYLQRLGGMKRVRRFITISSPHRGTWTAYLRGNPGVRQMRPGSTFLRDLNSDCHTLASAGFVSIWTGFDLMIVPPRSSVLPVGRAIHVGVMAHPLMVTDRRVLRLVGELLCEPA